MARKDDAPAISLFSFQDIITSLTGIMFLFVLLLVLFMFDMKKKEKPADSVQSEAAQISASASAKAAELRKKLDLLKQQEKEFRKKIRNLENEELDTLWLKADTLRKTVDKHKTDIQNEERKKLQLESEFLKQQREQKMLSAQIAENEKKTAVLEDKTNQLKTEIEKTHAQTVKIKNALKYTMDNRTSYAPLLAECSADGVRVLECSSGKVFDLRLPDGSFAERKRKFLDFVQQRRGRDEYYTILIKPESFDYARLISDLEEKKITRGLEMLPDNNITLFGGN